MDIKNNTIVKFGDVVHLNTDRVSDPLAAGIERYVGLEHIEPENLHIRSWGLVAEGTTFTNRFKPGQVLFGKRRAYQRKVAVADFEGVCSSDIYVFESKDPNVLLPELVPFILQSEGFFEYAVKTSAGSLSPRTNWSHLANYEFILPPLDEQRRIADLLWATDKAISQNIELEVALQKLLSSQLVENFVKTPKQFSKEWKIVELQDLCDKPIVYGIVQAREHIENGIPYVRVVDMVKGYLSLEDMLRTTPEIDNTYRRARLEANDIVFTLRGVIGNVLIVPEELGGINISRGVARISPKDNLENYMIWVIQSPFVKSQITKVSTGSTFKEIKIGSLRKLNIPISINRNTVNEITETLSNTQNTLEILAKHIKVSKELKSKYMNQLLQQGN